MCHIRNLSDALTHRLTFVSTVLPVSMQAYEKQCVILRNNLNTLVVIFCVEENEKLKVQMSDKDMLIAKLMKKESQLKEELQSMKDTTTGGKSISTLIISKYISICVEDNEKQLKEREPVKDIGIQFDYIVPSMGKRYIISYYWNLYHNSRD